jgi:hypothetical protein
MLVPVHTKESKKALEMAQKDQPSPNCSLSNVTKYLVHLVRFYQSQDDRCLVSVRLSLIRFGSILVLITHRKTKVWKVVNHA